MELKYGHDLQLYKDLDVRCLCFFESTIQTIG
jgi:hypothetical protein